MLVVFESKCFNLEPMKILTTPKMGADRAEYILKLCSSLSYSSENNQELCDDLLEWVTSSGGNLEGLKVVQEGGGYGLISSKNLNEDNILADVERKILLSYDERKENSRLLELILQVPEELWSLRLGLKLLAERVHSDSLYWPYIRHLPMSFPGIPLFFSPQEVQALQYLPIQEQIKRRSLFLQKMTDELIPNYADVFSYVGVNINILGWAMVAVSTRAFRMNGKSRPASMVPLIDMANHNTDFNAKVVLSSSGGALLCSTKKILKGDPIHLSYGNYSNDDFLIDYGFTVENNPYDSVDLNFDPNLFWSAHILFSAEDALDEEVTLHPWQVTLLEKLSLIGENSSPNVKIFRDGVEGRLLAGARVINCNKPTDVKKVSLADLMSQRKRPVDRFTEERTVKSLIAVCTLVLGNFPTTIQEDQEQLQTSGLSHNMINAIKFRIGKKEILLSAIQVLKKLLDIEINTSDNLNSKPSSKKTLGFGKRK